MSMAHVSPGPGCSSSCQSWVFCLAFCCHVSPCPSLPFCSLLVSRNLAVLTMLNPLTPTPCTHSNALYFVSLYAISAMHFIELLRCSTSCDLCATESVALHSTRTPSLSLHYCVPIPRHLKRGFAEQQVCIEVSCHDITFCEVTWVMLKSPSPFSTWRGMNWRRVLPYPKLPPAPSPHVNSSPSCVIAAVHPSAQQYQ